MNTGPQTRLHTHQIQGKPTTSNGVHEHTLEEVEAELVAIKARLDALEGVSVPPDDLPGWRLVFEDDGSVWDPTRYFVYPPTWGNSNGTGKYGAPISSDGSKLLINLHTDSTGTPRCAAICPIPEGSLSSRGDLLSMRVEYELRADLMPGFKGVPLLWPMSGEWPRDGEINWPESHFDAQPRAFMHRQDGTSGSDQDYYSSPPGTVWQDKHKYAIEWLAGVSCEFFIDGVSIGKSTSRVPETPMHLVMQFETQLTSVKPDPSVNGNVEISHLRVWTPA